VKLKSALVTLAAGSLVPFLVFAVIAVATLVDHERRTMERETTGRVVSAMSAVDAELRGSINALQMLSASRVLQAGDLRAFHEQAQRVLATQPTWANITLSSVTKEPLVDATLPFGEPAPFDWTDAAFDIAVNEGRPAVGDVGERAASGELVRVRVPVIVDGAVRYVMSVPIKPQSLTDLLRAQRIDPEWVIVLVDRNRRVIARIPEVPLGLSVSVDFLAALARSSSGWFRGHTLEGRETYTPYVTSSLSGWTLGIAIPAAAIEAAAWRTAAIAIGGALTALAFAVALAMLFARRIEEPIASLARATEAMGRGTDFDVQYPGRIDEVVQLRDALREASAAIQQRQQLAQNEKTALERERRALQAADAAKDEFIATLSHELRNPLGALTSAAHLLKAVRMTEPIAVHARDVVERQVKQMTRLIEDLLDVGRIAAGKANLEPELFDVVDAARHLFDTWRESGRFAAHDVTLNATTVWVHADRARMEQILSNLVDNALKFTPASGHVRVTIARDDGHALVAVTDDGEGIEPGDLARIFDLFVQGGHGHVRGRSGLGIGLAMVKRLAELQGGSVEASSAGRGKGATFVVRMPAVDPPARPAASATPTARPAPANGCRRVVIIDDNDDIREMVRTALLLDGHDVRDARDGAGGLALAAQYKPDVIYVDIGLPDIDGYEVARRLRAQPGGADAFLIAVTGYGQAEDRRRATDAGFDTHLTKPVTPDALQQAIAAIAETRNARADARDRPAQAGGDR
jgi:signal transduction histidine kinase/ActR/RegA family two-component response regulator